jgi:hypothetical protein
VNPIIHRAAFCSALVMFMAASQAQEPPRAAPPAPPAAAIPPIPPVPPVPAWPFTGMPGASGDDVLTFVSGELGGRRVVSGAPYSATAVSETHQVLADGNRITRSAITQLARDGAGRTRQEQANGTVFIIDPVAGKRYVLNTEKRVARELPLTPRASGAHAVGAVNVEELRVRAEELRRWAQEFATKLRDELATPKVSVRVDRRTETDGTPGAIERVEIVRLGDGHAPPAPPMPPLPPMVTPPGTGTTQALPARDIGGVRAEGTRTTWTIPAGRIGNEKPIEVVSERWYSPELLLVLQSRHADPRFGERIYRLENLQRGEPSADLFRVPADYELRPTTAPKAEKK